MLLSVPLLVLAGHSLAGVLQEPPRLRTLLSNGSTLLVENKPNAKITSVQLFASSLRIPDSPENHGFKHLLEHLVLKGPAKDLDIKMESKGVFFTGRTLRDAMQIEFTCGADQIPDVLQTLQAILKPVNATPQDIATEIQIMQQEQALEPDSQRLMNAVWTIAFGDRGVSAFGDLPTMERATPDALKSFQEQLFAANDLVLIVSGPVDVEAVSKVCRAFLKSCSGKNLGTSEPRPTGVPGKLDIPDAFGEARAARVSGFKEAQAAWALAAAFGIASQFNSAFVTYTPSADNNLVVVGRTDETSGLGLKIDALGEADGAAIFPLGKAIALRWLSRQLADPSSSATIRGLLLCQGPSNKPEEMFDEMNKMTWQDFYKGVLMFRKDQADIAVGAR